MICRTCLRASAFSRLARPSSSPAAALRAFSTTLPSRAPAATAGAAQSTPAASPPAEAAGADAPPAEGEAAAAGAPALSSCPPGTVLTGLSYFKGKQDPVAGRDDEYPSWLWDCLSVQQASGEAEADEAGDEFSKSKKQRRLAAKRQRDLEARMLASGDLSALAPKIPLQQQSVNLPGEGAAGTVEGAVAAARAREELRRAMRKERKAKIKEANYLKSM